MLFLSGMLAAAKQYLGDLDRLKKLVKLTVLMAMTEQFTEHASVARRRACRRR